GLSGGPTRSKDVAMVPAPWTWSGKQQESKQYWMCKFCTFRRTGAPLINYGITEKCYKCKLHKGAAFKCVIPSDSPSRTKRKADGANDAASASFVKLEKRLQQLEAESARLRGSPDSGGGDAAVESNESEELRDEIDGLSKHVQWLESVRPPWAELPLKAAREELEGARRKLYENKPLPAKLTALSRRAEQARIRYQKAEQDKAAVDQKLLQVCLQLEEEVRALASSQPADEPGQHQAMDLTGLEIKLDEAQLLSSLGAIECVEDACKLAPKLAEVLKSCAGELLGEPPDKRARGAASGGQPSEPPPAAWDTDAIEVELLRKDVGPLADAGGEVEDNRLRPVTYGGLLFPDYSCLGLCEYLNGEEASGDACLCLMGNLQGNALINLALACHTSTCTAHSKVKVAGDKQPMQPFGVSTEFTVVCYTGNSWATVQRFVEWCVLDQLLQADIFVLQGLRLAAGEQFRRGQAWARARGYRLEASPCAITGSSALSTSCGVGLRTRAHIPVAEYLPACAHPRSRLKFQRAVLGDMQILFVSVYGEAGVGLKGNVELLGALIEAVRASRLPFCIAGDWDIEAELFG
ncbi:unnamed protein product, partial [Prorocentrum cordatum]